MAANNASREIRDWLRSQGHEVSSRGAIPQRYTNLYYDAHPQERPAGGVRLLPGPDATEDELAQWEDMGVIGPESDAEPPGDLGEPPVPDEPREPVSDDSGPAHARKEWRKGKRADSKPRGGARVTANIRSDIEAKISLALDVPGRIWQARDPVCGGVWVEQVPAMASAWTRYVCQSPQLVEWFTSTGGGFILFLDILAATYPVAAIWMAHHVYHSLEEQAGNPLQPDYDRYAA